MADISILSRLVNGFQRNVDVSQNSLVVGSLKIGSSTPVEITKAIATKLIAIQAAADADGTFDTRYHTKTALAANGGAALIGGSTGETVEDRLLAVEAAVGTGSAADISFDPTGTSLSATDVQELGVELDSRVQATEAVANAAIPATEKGANNGVATLDGAGKVPLSQLPNSIMEYKGTWDADTNTPALSNGSGNAGDVWRVTVAGTHDFGAGPISFEIGDYAIYNAAGEYEKADTTDAVSSVNGQQGAVILDTDDIQEGSTNLYHTDERAQDAVGAMVQDSDTISLTYDDGTPSLVAEVKDNSIDENKLTTSVADQKTITGGNGSALAVQEAPKESRSMTAGESMADDVTFAVRLALDGETAARVYKADNDATADNKFFAIGLCRKVGGASAGDPVDVIRSGPYTLGANDTPFNAADIGKPVYLGSAGALTVTPPSAMNSAAYRVGFVENTTIVMVDRQLHGIN